MKLRVKKVIENDPVLNSIKPLLKEVEAYLVGGYIRDIAVFNLSESPKDRDIVLFNTDTEAAARKIADALGGAFVELDPENKIYRVVLGEDCLDIAEGLRGNVKEDIERRDFTINSIFYPLGGKAENLNKAETLGTEGFLDENGGFFDIENKIIRTQDIKNLSDDPLRTLRAYRFQAEFGFKIEQNILDFIKNNPNCLDTIAKERVNQEIVKMFSGAYLVQTLTEMYNIGFLERVFPFIRDVKKIPPNSHHHLDLVHHLIETVKHIRINNPLLKLAAFYHDIGKPSCWTIEEDTGRHRFIGHDEKGGELVRAELSGLKFSKKQIEYVSKMVKNHIYPSSLMTTEATTKAMARFVRKIHPDVEDLIELARADRLSARGKAVTDEMVEKNLKNLEILREYYINIKESLKVLPKLIDGREIMEILNIEASPRLGEIIDELKEAQIAGFVKTKEDAIRFIKGL